MESGHTLILQKHLTGTKKARTQTACNQIPLGEICKQVANHAIYNLSTTLMVEVA